MSDGIVVIYGGKQYDDPTSMAVDIMRQMEDAPDRAAKAITEDLKKFLQRVATELAKTHGTHWTPNNTGGPNLHVRSGEGIASIMKSIKVYGSSFANVGGNIDTGTMGMHEKGGWIAASGSGYLTIPLPAALDSRGVPIYPDSSYWRDTFIQRSKQGNLIIFQNRGQRTPTPLYVLKREVYIPPRLHMEETLLGDLPFFLERLIDRLALEFSK